MSSSRSWLCGLAGAQPRPCSARRSHTCSSRNSRQSRAGWQHTGSSARPFPLFLTLHTLSPPSHVPPLSPGSRPALGLCCSVVGREAPRGSRLDVCAGQGRQSRVVFASQELVCLLRYLSRVLGKNPVGINPKEWCWFFPHVRNEVLDGTGRILGCILGEYGY